jgi:hypothetical protein
MNCFRSLKNWDRWSESHLRHGCLCVFMLSYVYVAALRRTDPPSKESYRLCKRSRNRKSGQGPTEGCRVIDRLYTHCLADSWRWAVAKSGAYSCRDGPRHLYVHLGIYPPPSVLSRKQPFSKYIVTSHVARLWKKLKVRLGNSNLSCPDWTLVVKLSQKAGRTFLTSMSHIQLTGAVEKSYFRW